MPIYICKICEMKGKKVVFYRRDDLRDHIKSVHREYIERIISKLTPIKKNKLIRRGIDLENWAAGCLIGVGC